MLLLVFSLALIPLPALHELLELPQLNHLLPLDHFNPTNPIIDTRILNLPKFQQSIPDQMVEKQMVFRCGGIGLVLEFVEVCRLILRVDVTEELELQQQGLFFGEHPLHCQD